MCGLCLWARFANRSTSRERNHTYQTICWWKSELLDEGCGAVGHMTRSLKRTIRYAHRGRDQFTRQPSDCLLCARLEREGGRFLLTGSAGENNSQVHFKILDVCNWCGCQRRSETACSLAIGSSPTSEHSHFAFGQRI